MQIATEHAEAVGQRAGIGVEERLFLDRVALHAADVPPRHQQPAVVVEADLADADGAVGKRTAVAARRAAEAAVGQCVVEFALAGFPREHIGKVRHVRMSRLYARGNVHVGIGSRGLARDVPFPDPRSLIPGSLIPGSLVP